MRLWETVGDVSHMAPTAAHSRSQALARSRASSVKMTTRCFVRVSDAFPSTSSHASPFLNRLTAIRVGAVRGVESPRTLGHLGELSSSLAERLYVPIEAPKVPLQQIDHMFTCRLPLASKFQNRRDLRQCEPGVLRVFNEPQPLDRSLPVVAVPVGSSVWFWEETDPLVVANRLRGNTHLAGQFSNLHGLTITHLTFQSNRRCTVSQQRRYRQIRGGDSRGAQR